jgi:DNA polymerase/3'-5' exonuclease PolX
MELAQAQTIAQRIKAELAPHCERIEIAGSIRRRKPEVKDVEIVCIPKTIRGGLFGDLIERSPGFRRTVDQWTPIKGLSHGKYTQRRLPDGLVLDLFTATPENWGLILAIRTGSAEFSHNVLAAGWVRRGYSSRDGTLYHGDEPVEVREEPDLFRLIALPWVEPERRL